LLYSYTYARREGTRFTYFYCVCVYLVKLWATNMEHSVATLEAKANVCCVKFNPATRYNIAFGSAGMYILSFFDMLRESRSPNEGIKCFKTSNAGPSLITVQLELMMLSWENLISI